MIHKLGFIIATLLFMAACNNKQNETPEQWSEEDLNQWYSEGEWKHDFQISPDESINPREMAIRYYRNADRWETAFTWLQEQDLENIEPGRYELEGSDVFVSVTEYVPKPIEDVQFEAHRVYADIQYVATGQEQISIVPIDDAVITEPYDEENDVMFLSTPASEHRIATPDRFFVFFPSDAHRPSVRVNENDSSLVKKVVVKVRLN